MTSEEEPAGGLTAADRDWLTEQINLTKAASPQRAAHQPRTRIPLMAYTPALLVSIPAAAVVGIVSTALHAHQVWPGMTFSFTTITLQWCHRIWLQERRKHQAGGR